MALCLANSLIACHGFDPYDQMVRYKWWYRHGYMSSTGHCFDIGAATRQSIQEFETRQRRVAKEHEIPFDQMDTISDSNILQQVDVYCSRDGVAGNGALMRLAPVPLFFYQDPKLAVEYSGISGQITHGDTKAYDACRYYGALIVATLHNAKKDELLSEQFYDNHKEWFGDKGLHPDIMSIARGSFRKKGGYADGIRGKGYIVNALEAALWAFWSDDNSFEIGALKAVNLGDDTDTTAAIYGQLAGAYYGYKQLPDKWLKSVYAIKFMKCVSQWIAYEGDQWFKNQSAPVTTETLVNSYTTTPNKATNSSTISKQSLHFDTNNGSISITYNPRTIIQRKAVDPSGRVGFFYDGYQDCVIPSSKIKSQISESCQLLKCVVENGGNTECQNILRFIGFDDELRLNVLSCIASPIGIASIVGYPYLIDEWTRILYYSCVTRQDLLSDNTDELEKNIQGLKSNTMATHVITQVHSGIEVIVLLRLASDDTTTVDDTLKKIRECLINGTKLSEKVLIDKIRSTHSYSNISDLTNRTTITDLYDAIYKIKSNVNDHKPIHYTLQPIHMFYTDYNKNRIIYKPMKQMVAQNLEKHLFRLLLIKKMRSTFPDNKITETMKKELDDQLKETERQLSRLENRYKNEMIRFQQLILNIRRNNNSQQKLEPEILTDEEFTRLKRNIDDYIYSLKTLKEKGAFISQLEKRGFNYWNVNTRDIKQDDDENTIEKKLIKNNYQQRILCSNDTLNLNNWKDLNQLWTQMTEERTKNSNLQLIYADFTYSPCELNGMKIFPSRTHAKANSDPITPISIERQPSVYTTDDTINIILLGKSGVGKSTLINSFVNYAKWKKYPSVQPTGLVEKVLIAFFHPIYNGWDERFVQIGNFDPNEDYDHFGQSVTQNCKSYTFNIDGGQKLRLIDTPGFCDARGQCQDESIMENILSCITNLTHLNAICILLESGDTQLKVYPTCLTKLFGFLGSNAANNVVFCFTKALSNEINSDQRDASVKQILQSPSMKNIPFNRKEYFIFDSTYFINSAILSYFTTFFNNDKSKLEKSRQISYSGWDNLLNCVRQTLRPHHVHRGLQKVVYAQFEISELIRPMLETVRNILRNQILWYRSSSYDFFIELDSIPILHHFAICYSCPRGSFQCGSFWIMSESLHDYRNNCGVCHCNPSQHLRIKYKLHYTYSANKTKIQPKQMQSFQNLLLHASIKFSHFLTDVARATAKDPFFSYLNQMIDEESLICEATHYNELNSRLRCRLVEFKQAYQQRIKYAVQNRSQSDLMAIDSIIDLIMQIKQIPMVKIQVDAARRMTDTAV